ncbi:hypothetical protein LAZ67_16001827 [Cordylochernes scorpioides]|uniref:Mariner Mos1 transposase n=1 Tax=Cordylochernes scorpioides TaxID=51811 RepID=A0ABY6LE34_9ARAC|nr:hypothetical protein LAZ67_16001827 [Cordylochernes scorpioides]
MLHGLVDQHFSNYDEAKKWIDEWIAAKEPAFFRAKIRHLPKRWEKECRCNQSDVSTCGSAYPSTSSGGPTSHLYRHPETCARHPRSIPSRPEPFPVDWLLMACTHAVR